MSQTQTHIHPITGAVSHFSEPTPGPLLASTHAQAEVDFRQTSDSAADDALRDQPTHVPPTSDLWITTASGLELDLLLPNPSSIDIYGIAWALAQINRFTGHARRPYSVAEHSLLVADIAEHELHLDVHGQLAALMHDAHEAYCGDLHTPGKRAVGQAWTLFERHLQAPVQRKFALHGPSRVHAAAIKFADLTALACERRDLLPRTPTPWPVLADVPPLFRINLNAPERRDKDWEFWRDRFLDRFHELDFARNAALFGQMGFNTTATAAAANDPDTPTEAAP